MASVVALAARLGLDVGEPVPLRSTNNLVMWLRPSDVVAKISSVPGAASAELAVARALTDKGAPIVSPARRIGQRPYGIAQGEVTFWEYVPQDGVTPPRPESIARALGDLHGALSTLKAEAVSRTSEEVVTGSLRALDGPDFAPELRSDDRDLLRRALSDGVVALSTQTGADRPIHGSPHRMNILVDVGVLRFIDFETVQRGPLEWDLAHLEPMVAHVGSWVWVTEGASSGRFRRTAGRHGSQ